MSEPYTVVMTSCGRFDLLRQTLDTLLPRLDGDVAAILIGEDSGDEAVYDALPNDSRIQVLLNRPRLGQMRNIDRLYEHVETEFVFHCEEDWDFFRDGFIEDSFRLLKAEPTISMVGLRPRSEVHDLVKNRPTESAGGVEFFRPDPKSHPDFFGYSFNPGLRRLSDFRLFAPITRLWDERYLSYAFKRLGMTTAYLESPAVRHLGDDRHVEDSTREHRVTVAGVRGVVSRLGQSVAKRAVRTRRKLLPQWDPTERFIAEAIARRDQQNGLRAA